MSVGRYKREPPILPNHLNLEKIFLSFAMDSMKRTMDPSEHTPVLPQKNDLY